jgi:hypothetical protein
LAGILLSSAAIRITSSQEAAMPPRGVKSPKRKRQYEHIKESSLDRGVGEERAEEIAARTVNKQRAQAGETKGARKGGRKSSVKGSRKGAAASNRKSSARGGRKSSGAAKSSRSSSSRGAKKSSRGTRKSATKKR